MYVRESFFFFSFFLNEIEASFVIMLRRRALPFILRVAFHPALLNLYRAIFWIFSPEKNTIKITRREWKRRKSCSSHKIKNNQNKTKKNNTNKFNNNNEFRNKQRYGSYQH